MNVSCSADVCPVILDSTCVFYSGGNLIYTGINTNDNLQLALQKIDAKFKNASVGYIFNNGVTQTLVGGPVGLGGSLTQNTTIDGAGYTLTLNGTLRASSFVTIGGTSSQFVKGDGSLDSTTYQPSGNYITDLTGDGVASGPGSAVFTLASVNPTFGTWGSATKVPIITTDVKGRITNISQVTIYIPSDSLSFGGDLSGFGTTGTLVTLTLNNVNSNVYTTNTPLKFSVNAKGLVTSAAPITNLDIDGIYGYTPIGDAPSDGSTYGRKNGGWVVVSFPSVTWGSITGTITAQTDLITYLSTNYTPQTRTLTINGTTYDLSANRSWTITGGVSAVTASSPLSSTGGSTPDISIQQANASQGGYLSSADWTTFNNKFNLPSLTAGSVLFSNGTTIAQDNSNLFWDDSVNRLDVNKISIGASTSSYIEMKSLAGDRKFLLGNGGSGVADFVAYDGNYMRFTYSTTNATPLPDKLMYIEPTVDYTAGTNTHNVLYIRPIINTSGGTTLLRGMYYNPNLISTVGITNIAWENTSGDIIHGNLATGGVNEMVTVDTNGKLGKQTIPSGGNSRSVNSVSSNANAGSASGTDYIYLVSGTTTITLPSPTGNTNLYTIKRTGTGVVSIATTSGTIDGSTAPININVQYVSVDLISDGTNWFII